MAIQCLVLRAFLAAAVLPAVAETVSFNEHVRPILSDRCFTCHGSDEPARKAGLRLDTEEGSRMRLDVGRQVIRPGDPEGSELLRRIRSSDPDEMMPPPDSHLSLTGREKDLLELWIRQGAMYQGHWAFIPVPEAVKVPASEYRNPIDAFVAARLAEEGLKLSPEASRETLIRRLSFDLTGLPPSPAEIRAFIGDTGDDALERLVDRLLTSPHYGEQRAVDWLDLARFADTYGYQADVEMNMWPWRDWVIRAFNENLPYDDFLTWQLAGDLLPDATHEQRLATAFNRLHRQTNEGGSIDEEFRIEYVSDRVHTFGTAMLGLTLECARCHDHKYDPVSQRDYYALSAFFNNIDESGLYSHFTRAVPAPTLLRYADAAQEREHVEMRRAIANLERTLGAWQPSDEIAIPELPLRDEAARLAVAPVAAFPFDELDGNRSPNLVSTNAAEFRDAPELAPGWRGRAVRFNGDNEVVCQRTGEFNRTTEFSIALWLKRTEEQERAVVLHFSRAWSDSGSRGYELVLEHGRPFFGLIHFWPGNAIAVRARDVLPPGEWMHVTLTYDGSSNASGLGIFVNGRRAPTEIVRDHLFKDILHREAWGDSDVGGIHLTLGGRFRDAGFRNGLIDELQVFDRDLSRHALAGDAAYADVAKELAGLRGRENSLVNDLPEIMVMEEMSPRRETFVLRRGAYDLRGESVSADTPAGVFPFAPDLPRDRLGLARWLTDRRNPLTARVAVNRVWKQHFGRGLVATVEDFGLQGVPPTHPALLDWLAAWFMDHGWDLKALHKLITTSATYRQSSRVTAWSAARDPQNLLLGHGPSDRLSGEQIRDQALAASGLLVPALGGPSVKPYQPAGLWEESGTGKSYQQDTGDGLHRRSLYTFWRRTAPPPSMILFGATSREVCTARRETAATPLQALALMNDPQIMEAGRVLAARLLQDRPEPAAAIANGFVVLIGREPAQKELATLQRLFELELAGFTAQPETARRLLETGAAPVPVDLHAPTAAALTLVLNTLMNYDEFVMKR